MVGLRGQLEISLYIVQHLGGTFRFDLALDAHLSLEYSLFSQNPEFANLRHILL